MNPFQLGFSNAANWQDAVAECLDTLGVATGSLGFIYITEPFADHLPKIVATLQAKTSVVDWVGTVGFGVCCTGREFYEVPAMVIMLTDLGKDQYRVFEPVHSDLTEFRQRHQQWIKERNPMVAVVHADPHDRNTPELVCEFADQLAHGFLVGGLSSAQSGSPQVASKVVDGGLSGVLLAGDVSVTSGLSQGCSPLGPTHEITECQGNVLISLDQRPALDVLTEDIGELLSRNLQQIGGYVFAGLPVTGSDTGDYVVRNLLGVDQNQKLIAVAEHLSPGQSIMFCRRDSNTARDDLRRMLADLSARTNAPRGGVYFSCVARGRHMFGADSAEMTLVKEVLGDIPIVGFFANGEISHNRLYGYTGVLTLIS